MGGGAHYQDLSFGTVNRAGISSEEKIVLDFEITKSHASPLQHKRRVYICFFFGFFFTNWTFLCKDTCKVVQNLSLLKKWSFKGPRSL